MSKTANAARLVGEGLDRKAQGRSAEAEACFRAALCEDPAYPPALGNLGVVLRLAGRSAEALPFLEELVRLCPALAAASFSLGNARADLGQYAPAFAAYQHAIRLDPCYFEAWTNLGNLSLAAGASADAVTAYRRAVELRPSAPEAHLNLAHGCLKAERITEALASFEAALKLQPGSASALCDYGSLLKDVGNPEAALEYYRRAVELAPANALYQDCYLLGLTYAGTAPEEWYAAHRRFGQAMEAAPLTVAHANAVVRERPLRIGYVSGDFCGHAIANFVWPVLGAHDRNAFEVFAYYNGETADGATALIRARSDHWRDVARLDDAALAAAIRADQIDVLVDLSSHTAHNRLPVFARKPAPVQVTWLGYAATTGLTRIDWRITDARLDPPGLTERWHSERLMRLAGGSFCFSPSPACPEVGSLPALRGGGLTLGAFSNSAKLTRRTVALWSQVMLALPGSRLLIHVRGGDEPAIAQWIRGQFAAHGVEAQRVDPFGRRAFGDYMRLHQQVDLALDTLTFSGVTTSFYTLWMGVPVLTLPGESPITRGTAAILGELGLGRLVANDEADFVRVASDCAKDLAALAELRAGLRARMLASSLLDPTAFTRRLEDAYREMWRDWCARAA